MNLPIPDPLPLPTPVEAPPLRISIQLQDALETWYLTRTLETAAHMAGIGLRLGVRPEEADIVFLAPAESGGLQLLQRQGVGRESTLVAYSAAEVPGLRWLPRPARTRDARRLLDEFASRRQQAGAGARAPSMLALPFQVMDSLDLLLRIKRAIAGGEAVGLQCGLGFTLVLLPRIDKACAPVEVEVGEVCDSLRSVRLADMRTLSDVEAAKRAVETHRQSLSLSGLAWELALRAIPLAAARPLLEGMHLKLRARPDFSRLPATPEHLRWTDLLLRRDLSLSELLELSPDGLDGVARFANACSVLGLLEFVAAPE